ncbi:MAG: shikimate kinase [Candidatus Gastranaerophilales bacterium]|nr:shikimate kinase [Candidatus Gastranaerophilales bacterium]
MKNIVLIGLMGSGKTTIGKLLAQKLGLNFIDTDSIIEKEANKTINEIFENYGEELFRKLESNTIKEISKREEKVISTGGGIVENPENMQNLRKNGIIVYLEAGPKELYERIKGDNNRPLLKNNPKDTLKNLFEKRSPLYKQADIIVNTEHKESYEIINEIIEKYKNYAK